MTPARDIITPEQAGSLAGLFRERVRRSPDTVAYRQHDPCGGGWREYTWSEMAGAVARCQGGLRREGLERGERVAIMLRNCREWVMFDQAALGLGLVVVPLYTDDRAESCAYMLEHAGVRVLVIGGPEQWTRLSPVIGRARRLQRLVALAPVADARDPRLVALADWLGEAQRAPEVVDCSGDELATIVYTSGTTGRPKGVMLSHGNLLSNAHAALQVVPAWPGDSFLSFLPLSHTLERTAGYYLVMMAGGTVTYARSIPQLPEDLSAQRPTALISVPRIYERVHNRLRAQLAQRPRLVRALFDATVRVGWRRFLRSQGRAPWHPSLLLWPFLQRRVARPVLERMGGRLRLAICGGAPLSPAVARVFIGLGLELLQGYGLTETSPVISVNPADDNEPASVGPPIPGVQVRIGREDELLVKGPNVMLGYWDNPEATARMFDAEGWLHTGDQARLERGHLYITGRLKEIIVLANGEKAPPADMEMAITLDALFEQVMVIGEGRPYLAALAVLNAEAWEGLARELGVDPHDPQVLWARHVQNAVLARVARRLEHFPGYAQVRQVALTLEPWTVENTLLTPTLKLRRDRILGYHEDLVARLYAGHD